MAWPLQLISDPIRGFKYWDAKPTCPIMSWHFFRESLWCKLACGVQNSCCWQFHWRIWDPTSWKPQFFFRNSRHKGCYSAKVAPPSCARSILIYVVVSFFLIFHPDTWGDDPIWRAYFSDGLKPPNSYSMHQISIVLSVICHESTYLSLSPLQWRFYIKDKHSTPTKLTSLSLRWPWTASYGPGQIC